MPVILKPVNLGSSVGVAKVSDRDSFELAVENTFRYDNHLLIEEFINGREFEIAVLGNADAEATVAGEVIVSSDYEFYDFEAKYVDAKGAETRIPAEIDVDTLKQVKELVLESYRVLRCEDYARVDFFIDVDGKIYINEINTIPGFTNISMFPQLWEHEGLGNRQLISKMIDLCLDRHRQKNRLMTDFESGLN